MGAVDLVIQVESPKSVARGLQRIGRAGHTLDAVSKGRIFPKFRADLLESAVVAKRMREGGIEETQIPRNPLDVLAQQIVAICADEEIAVDELHELVRGAWNFRDLSRAALENDARHALRPVPLRGVRGAAPADRLGPREGRRAGTRRAHVGSPSRTPARFPTAASSASSSPTGAAGSASSTRRWSTRPGGPDVHARRHDLADRGDHARPRARLAGSRHPRGGAVLEGEGTGRPYELGEAIGRAGRELVALPRRGRRRAPQASTRSTRGRRRTWSPTSGSRSRRRGPFPPT